MQPKQAFATGISQPQPAQHEDTPEAATSEAQPKQAFATGISQPQPAQHEDVPEAATPEAQQKKGPKRSRNKASPPGPPNRKPAQH
jgi:hypothetical protein